MSLLIDMLQGVVVLVLLGVGFVMVVGVIIDNLQKTFDFKDHRIGWVLFFILNLAVGIVIWLANSKFLPARSGLTKSESINLAHDYDRDINEILQNQIWLIGTVLFFFSSWFTLRIFGGDNPSTLKELQKPIALCLVSTLAISFFGLTESKRRLNEQAGKHSISHISKMCKDAQTTLNEMGNALDSNMDYASIYEEIRSGKEDLVFIASQVSIQTKYLPNSYSGIITNNLEERIIVIAEQANDVLISKILWDMYTTYPQDENSSVMFQEDFKCDYFD
jgi:hypothetical protein